MSATYNVRMAVYLQVSDQRHEIHDVRLEDREKRFSAFDPAALSPAETRNDYRMPVLHAHRIN